LHKKKDVNTAVCATAVVSGDHCKDRPSTSKLLNDMGGKPIDGVVSRYSTYWPEKSDTKEKSQAAYSNVSFEKYIQLFFIITCIKLCLYCILLILYDALRLV